MTKVITIATTSAHPLPELATQAQKAYDEMDREGWTLVSSCPVGFALLLFFRK